MTEEDIKATLSEGFLRLISNRDGFTCTRPDADYGVDLRIERVRRDIENGRVRMRSTGETVDVQLKCTTEEGITRDAASLKYDLAVKNFNDLVARLSDTPPLYLVLFVLPTDATLWLQDNDVARQLILGGSGYIFRPPAGSVPSANAATVRITITSADRVSLGHMTTLFDVTYG